MDFTIFVSGVLWLIPVLFGIGLLLLCFVAYVLGKKWDWKTAKRIKVLMLGRALIPVLPLSGILGTVWGLIDTLAFMGRQSSGSFNMHEVVSRFGTALNTTFWGVLFAVLALILYQTLLAQLERPEDGQ